MLRILTLATLVGLAAPTDAQIIPSLNLGVAGGANFGSVDDARTADLENSTGYHVGLYADVAVPFAALRTGVYYLQAGDLETADGTPVASADFVSVPVDLHLQTPTPVAKAYLLLGPEVRFALNTEEDVEAIVDRSAVNVAGNVGLGAKFGSPLGGLSGFLEVRYARDLTSFAEEQGLETDNEYTLSLFMLRAGVGL